MPLLLHGNAHAATIWKDCAVAVACSRDVTSISTVPWPYFLQLRMSSWCLLPLLPWLLPWAMLLVGVAITVRLPLPSLSLSPLPFPSLTPLPSPFPSHCWPICNSISAGWLLFIYFILASLSSLFAVAVTSGVACLLSWKDFWNLGFLRSIDQWSTYFHRQDSLSFVRTSY